MQQLNQIIIEGNVLDIFEDGKEFYLEHDSIKGPPVIINVAVESPIDFVIDPVKNLYVRVVGRLGYHPYKEYTIYAEHLEVLNENG